MPKACARLFIEITRYRCLARDYERLDTTLQDFHSLSFVCLRLTRMFHPLHSTP